VIRFVQTVVLLLSAEVELFGIATGEACTRSSAMSVEVSIRGQEEGGGVNGLSDDSVC
jgi:hypothetical protein